jgi:hypothetical protein
MRARLLIAAAALIAAPSLASAADMAIQTWSPNCAGLAPVDEYVPPQTAYIVACTVELPPPTVIIGKPVGHGFHDGLFGHGSKDAVATVDWGYGNPATHEAKLVYLQKWSRDRPPVHMLIAPR